MAGVVRVGDKDSAKQPMAKCSTNVFVNGVGACRIGDEDSAKDKLIPADGRTINVFVNGIGIGIVGDKDTKKDKKINGSTNVFIN